MRKVGYVSMSILLLLFGLVSAAVASDQHQHEMVASVTASGERISVEQVQHRIQQDQPVLFVDTRTDGAWNRTSSKIPGAVRVRNNGQLADLVKEVSKESFIVAYCT